MLTALAIPFTEMKTFSCLFLLITQVFRDNFMAITIKKTLFLRKHIRILPCPGNIL